MLSTVVDNMRESIHAIRVTSCASKVHRASGPGRGKPVLICILALGFHAIISEHGTFTKTTIFE